MNILIIAAHGSRKKASNDELAILAGRLKTRLSDRFDRVAHAFLQLAEPLLEDTLNEMAAKGDVRVVVFPFFIGAGSHIKEDIPRLVEDARQRYPDADIVLTRHLGALETIDGLIAGEALKAVD